jgi:hypothetical protein
LNGAVGAHAVAAAAYFRILCQSLSSPILPV